MIPADIGPHPDAPHHYIPMRKPADWSDEDCATLTVRRVGATGDMLHEPAARLVRDDLPSGEFAYPCFMSEWRPTAEEIRLINAGEPVRLLVCGNTLPPMRVWVREQSEI